MTERDDLQAAQSPQGPGLLPRNGLGVIAGVSEGQGAQCPLVQGAELQHLEDTRQGGTVGTHDTQVAPGSDSQVQVGEQVVEAAVTHHLVKVVTQGLTGLSLDLVGMSNDSVEPVIEVEPLGGRLGAHARDPGKVVAGLTHEGGEVRVALGRHPVAFLNLHRRHTTQRGDALDRVEHRAAVGDGLEGVAVSGADEDLHSLRLGRGRQGGQNVVRLVARSGECSDAHGFQDLLDELDLPEEGLRSLVAGALVLGVLLGAKGASRQVEGHRDVRGALVLQEREEHGDETVDGVGGLAGRRREVIHRQRIERAKCHGVAVDEEKPIGNRIRGGLRCWARRRAGRGGAHRASLGP